MIKKQYFEDEIPNLPPGMQRFIKHAEIPVVARPVEVEAEPEKSEVAPPA
jgi:hypothetical protein